MKNILFIIATFFLYTFTADAASVYMTAQKELDNRGQFSVLVSLDTGGVSINSVDISITYPKSIVSFKGYKEDGGIKKLWLLTPKDEGGEIHFSGIIPGGVDGIYDPDKTGVQPIPLAVLLFSPINSGLAEFSVARSNILQNDGLGTELIHTNVDTEVLVNAPNQITEENKENILDNESPEPFIIEYIPSGIFSETPSMISFSTIDALSGIEKYQVKDGHSIWKDVVSPLATPKGIVKRGVTIRAIDFAGNIRESNIEIPGLVSSIQLIVIFILFVSCYFVFFVVKRRR